MYLILDYLLPVQVNRYRKEVNVMLQEGKASLVILETFRGSIFFIYKIGALKLTVTRCFNI